MSLRLYRNILLAVSIVILAAIVAVSNPGQMYSALLAARAEYVAAALVVTTVTSLLRVFKWSFLLKAKFTKLVPVQFFGIAVSVLTPGRVAEPTKALILKIRDNIPVSRSLPSIIWERVVDIIVIIIFAAFALTAVTSTQFSVYGYLGVVIFSGLIVALLLVLYKERFGLSVFGALRRLPLLRRLDRDFIKSFYSVRIDRGRIAGAFFLGFLIWFLDGFALYLVARAFGVSVDIFIAIGIMALAVMIGVASSLPGGLGSTEVVMILLLTAYGLQNPVAVTIVFIYRFVTIWYGLLLGFVSFVHLGRRINFDEVHTLISRGEKIDSKQ